jgi:hypothetical protein
MDKKMKPFHLVPLQCIRCGSPISSGSADMVYFCENCGVGLEFNGKEFEQVTVRFAKPILEKEREPDLHLPFWSFKLDITVQGKEGHLPLVFREDFFTSDGNPFSNNEALIEAILKKWSEKKVTGAKDFTIYVPAFVTTGAFSYSSGIGVKLTHVQPELSFFEESKKMESCVYNASDGLAIAEDEYISLQSSIIPNLLTIDLSFNLKEKEVIGIPYIRKEKGIFIDQIIGEMILTSALKITLNEKEK